MTILLAKWLMGALVFILTAELLPGLEIGSVYIALMAALFWGVISVTIRPLLLVITLPINVVTFGLFTFVINAFLLLFLASFMENFRVEGLGWALLGSLLIAVFNWLGNRFIVAVSDTSRR